MESYSPNVVFVDCFSTIIFRKVKGKKVFKLWAEELSNKLNIPWKKIYKTYTKTNFALCFKKLFTSFTLQENFKVVLQKMFHKLVKKYDYLDEQDFIKFAEDCYIKTELKCFEVSQDMINFLKHEKSNGKKIYLVSDFYCKSDVLKYWFKELDIIDIFDELYSSSDFDKEKATTKLYKYLIKLLQLNPKNITMYGDNLWSDVLMAKMCKLNAKRIKNNRG